MIDTRIGEYLRENGEAIITPVGTSMWPMLRNRRDTVLLTMPQGRLKKYDLPVYRREDGMLVMHRVMEVDNNSYTMCGDHQTELEHGIRDEQMIAVVKGFYRDEKYIAADNKLYMLYCKFWCKSLKRRHRMFVLISYWDILKFKIKKIFVKKQ